MITHCLNKFSWELVSYVAGWMKKIKVKLQWNPEFCNLQGSETKIGLKNWVVFEVKG